MKRALRIGAFWNWLPAFRAVAETEHLPTASEQLGVSASALSRTIRLLEDEVGQPLFDRVGRTIRLNGAGRKFLRAVRDAMRLMDEGLQSIEGRQFIGPVYISVPSPFAPILVMPAIADVAETHPEIVPHVRSFPIPAINLALKSGAIDIAVTDTPSVDGDVDIQEIAQLTYGLYCGASHPLASNPEGGFDEIADHAFASPVALDDGTTPDHWPADWPRKVRLRVTHLQVGIEAVLDGQYLAVLPDLVAKRYPFTRIATPKPFPVSGWFMIQRTELPVLGRAKIVADAIRAAAARLTT